MSTADRPSVCHTVTGEKHGAFAGVSGRMDVQTQIQIWIVVVNIHTSLSVYGRYRTITVTKDWELWERREVWGVFLI